MPCLMQNTSIIIENIKISIIMIAFNSYHHLFLVFITLLHTAYTDNEQVNATVYGVRWSLGTYFSYSNLYKTNKAYPNYTTAPQNSHYYTIAFNIHEKVQGDVFVKIDSNDYTCSHRKYWLEISDDHDGGLEIEGIGDANFTGFHMYKCYIYGELKGYGGQEFSYQIFALFPEFDLKKRNYDPQKILNRKITTNRTVLFTSSFRPPLSFLNSNNKKDKMALDKNIIVLGDWGMVSEQIYTTRHYIPIIEALVKQINQDSSIVIAIFLGDLAYDFIGEKYINFLKYMQPITQKIVFMATPGNHDYIYHEDSFQFFAQTFLHPQWQKYYNYYYTFIIGDILFINISPQDAQLSQKITVNVSPLQYLNQDFHNEGLSLVPSLYHVIVFTHYPIFCSKKGDGLHSCQKNQQSFKEYRKEFKNLGMDMYLSGHLHYYERTKGICDKEEAPGYSIEEPKKKEEGDKYGEKCPVYIIEGAAGNNYFLEPDHAVTPLDFTAKIVEGSGYGILSLYKNLEKGQQQLQYIHYKMVSKTETIISDKIIKKLPKLTKIPEPRQKDKQKEEDTHNVYNDTDLLAARIWEMTIILVLIIIGTVVCFCFGRKFVRNFGNKGVTKKTENVQLVEQNLGGFSISDKRKEPFEPQKSIDTE